jgi:hypothetical protein
MVGRADMVIKIEQALVSLSLRHRRKAMNAWILLLLERAQAQMRLLGAASTFTNRAFRKAFNTWAGKATVDITTFKKLERSVLLWKGTAIVKGFFAWIDYAKWRAEQPDEYIRAPSPTGRRRLTWAKKRSGAAQRLDVSGDDKYQCVRMLLSPHASLALRNDGTVLRVVAIHRPASEPLCTVDLVEGYDASLLRDGGHVPLTGFAQDVPNESSATEEAAVESAGGPPTYTRVSISDLSAPEHPLIVPHFFGGRLELTNGLDVRVIDCAFDASQAVVEDDDPRPPGPALRRVLLTLIDAHGVAVGQPAWCELVEVLEMLHDKHIVVAACAAEDELRRRRRVALHVQEQRKLALHHLRQARTMVSAAHTHTHSIQPPTRSATLGVADLLKQLTEAAPSLILDEKNQAVTRADAFKSAKARVGPGGQVYATVAPHHSSAGSLKPRKPSPKRPRSVKEHLQVADF